MNWRFQAAAVLISLFPMSAQADEAWHCQLDQWQPGSDLFRTERNVLLVPPADPGMGNVKRLPIVRNDNDALIAISPYPENQEFEIVIIDKRLQSVRFSVVNMRNTLDEDEQFRGHAKRPHECVISTLASPRRVKSWNANQNRVSRNRDQLSDGST